MARILVTEPISKEPLQKLQDRFDVEVAERNTFNDESPLANAIAGYDALLCMLSTPVTHTVLEAASKLKIIANYAVGYDNINIETAKKRGIHVANTPGVLTEATADTAFALLLAVARKIPEAEDALRNKQFDGWHPLGFLGLELFGKKMGIIGMGNIGSAVARRAAAFGMDILYHNRSRVDRNLEAELDATFVDNIEDIARQADILSLNCPLTPNTHHLINARILEIMPGHALLINTARGAVVDESALASALHSYKIAGAGLDVFEEEPKIHPDLLSAPNVVLTPHIGSATEETRAKMGYLAVDAIMHILEGKDAEELSNLVC